MSESGTAAQEITTTPTEGDTAAGSAKAPEQDEEKPEASISKCDVCKAAVAGASAGLIVGGVIVAAPEEVTIIAIVTALSGLGMILGPDQIKAWIKEAINRGIKTVEAFAEFICKKLGIC